MTRSQETIFSDVSEESLPQPASLNSSGAGLLRAAWQCFFCWNCWVEFTVQYSFERILLFYIIFRSPTQEEGVDHANIGSLAYIELVFFIDTGEKYTRL